MSLLSHYSDLLIFTNTLLRWVVVFSSSGQWRACQLRAWLALRPSECPLGCWLNQFLRSASGQKSLVCIIHLSSQYLLFWVSSFPTPNSWFSDLLGAHKELEFPVCCSPCPPPQNHPLCGYDPTLPSTTSIPTWPLSFPVVFWNHQFDAACVLDVTWQFYFAFPLPALPVPPPHPAHTP